MNTNTATFQKNGFDVLTHLVSPSQIEDIYQNILDDIKKSANQLNCSLEHYLTNVSRWVHPSPITHSVEELATKVLKNKVSDFFGEEVHLSKFNIISKSAYAPDPVPCHQDMAYSPKDPYEFSLWLSLQETGLQDGVLEFLPHSHLTVIAPAVDFWQPNFIDRMFLSKEWQNHYKAVPVQSGDAILFDARIWHRSAKNTSGLNRFALVTRWRRTHYRPTDLIPNKIPAPFGMWTCGDITGALLQQGLQRCFNQGNNPSLIENIQLWQEKLSQDTKFAFKVDIAKVQNALHGLFILHTASELHNGGDAQGVVYPNLWHCFLNPLSQWLKQHD